MNFFLFLLFLIFLLPTNIPGLVEALLTIPLSVTAIITLRKNPRAGYLSRDYGLLWLLTLCVLIAGTIYSRSSSMSLITLVRYIEGCVLFIIAPYLTANRMVFMRYMVVFGIVSSVLFFAYTVFPSIGHMMPAYNSIASINGHHPIAHTIIAVFPFLFALQSSRTWVITRYLIIGAAFILSAARGAWIVTTVLFILQGIHHRIQKHKHTFFIAAIILVCVIILTAWATTLPQTQKETLMTQVPVIRRFAKDTNLGLRRDYMQQAVTAIRDSPFTGHGPGTFALLSRLYQTQTGNFSRYAHSFPLEVLAEQGLVGGGVVLLLLTFTLISAIYAVGSKAYAPFGWSVIAIYSYSLFEINLNNTPHWLMFWMIAGVLAQNNGNRTHSLRTALRIMIAGLIMFSLVMLASWVQLRGIRTNTAIIWPTASHKQMVLDYLQHTQHLTASDLRIIYAWHAQDPDIRIALAQRLPGLYPGSITLDPKNTYAMHLYFRYLTETGKVSEFASFLCTDTPSCPLITSKQFLTFLKEKQYTLSILPYLTGNDGYAKFLYLLGVNLYTFTGDSLSAIYLWQMARQEAPHWAFYYLEIAGAYYHWLHDEVAAKQTLDECMNHPLAKKGCKIIPDITRLLHPVLYSRDIMMIPAIQ